LRASEKFALWLKKIATNLCRNWLESAGSARELSLEAMLSDSKVNWRHNLIDPNPTVLERLEAQESTSLIFQMIDLMPPEYSIPIGLFYFESLSYRKIAERLGVPLSTVKWRLHKARMLLRQEVLAMAEIIEGVKTGFTQIDAILGGLKPGEFTVIAGAPGVGKSALAHDIMRYVSIHQKSSVLLLSPEISQQSVVVRLLAAEAEIQHHNLEKGDIEEKDWRTLRAVAGRLSDAPIYIDDTPDPDVAMIRTLAHRVKAESDIQMVVLDHIQLQDNMDRAVSGIFRELKRLSLELSLSVLGLLPLRHCVDKKPTIFGSCYPEHMEEYVDTILFLYRDDYHEPSSPDKGITKINIKKRRGDPAGMVELRFMGEYPKFADL
jgi:RNA polymerase sigma factor (sigma-70 family)